MKNLLKINSTVIILSIIVCAALAFHFVVTAFSGSATGYVTGYAMLDQYGSSGREVIQGYAATHGYTYCPSDLATGWGWGTKINTPGFIYYHRQDGGTVANSAFYKYDTGNKSCSEGNYWIDTYHGRYKPSTDSYLCDNYYGFCYTGANNNCTDAINTGRHWWTYTYTLP